MSSRPPTACPNRCRAASACCGRARLRLAGDGARGDAHAPALGLFRRSCWRGARSTSWPTASSALDAAQAVLWLLPLVVAALGLLRLLAWLVCRTSGLHRHRQARRDAHRRGAEHHLQPALHAQIDSASLRLQRRRQRRHRAGARRHPTGSPMCTCGRTPARGTSSAPSRCCARCRRPRWWRPCWPRPNRGRSARAAAGRLPRPTRPPSGSPPMSRRPPCRRPCRRSTRATRRRRATRGPRCSRSAAWLAASVIVVALVRITGVGRRCTSPMRRRC